MNADEMPAGHEINALVAEGIMGWTQVRQADSTGDLCGIPSRGAPPSYILPHYSTDIAVAFQVVDKLLDGTRTFVLQCWSLENDHWQATFKGKLSEGNEEVAQYGQLVYAYAETRPLAICRAALKVMAE